MFGSFKLHGKRQTPLPDSPGEAVSRFRNDVLEIPLFAIWINDIITGLGIIAISIWLMAKISPWITVLSLLPVAVPGMVLGLAYIFVFNAPGSPLNRLYGTLAILVISNIVHYFTVPFLTAM